MVLRIELKHFTEICFTEICSCCRFNLFPLHVVLHGIGLT